MGLLGKLLGTESGRPRPASIDDDNFESEVWRSSLPVLLDVWSPTCAPCKKLEPIIMDLSKQYDGRVRVAELNAAASPKTAARLGVRGTPTVVYIHKGKVLERVVGLRSSLYHVETIEELFGVPPKE